MCLIHTFIHLKIFVAQAFAVGRLGIFGHHRSIIRDHWTNNNYLEPPVQPREVRGCCQLISALTKMDIHPHPITSNPITSLSGRISVQRRNSRRGHRSKIQWLKWALDNLGKTGRGLTWVFLQCMCVGFSHNYIASPAWALKGSALGLIEIINLLLYYTIIYIYVGAI
jgi:hypothetical protein